MQARSGFTLTEMLIAMLVTVSIIVSVTRVIPLILYSEQTSLHIQAAREVAARVFAYLDPRVKNCGIGLWACPTIYKMQLAFGRGAQAREKTLVIAQSWDSQSIPVRIYERNKTGKEQWIPLGDEQAINDNESLVFQGECLSLIYAMPTGIFLTSDASDDMTMTPGMEKVFRIIPNLNDTGTGYASVKKVFDENFNETEQTSLGTSSATNDFFSWCALPGLGLPAYVVSIDIRANPSILSDRENKVVLKLAKWVAISGESLALPPIIELYKFEARRFFVSSNTLEFRYQDLQRNWIEESSYPRESNVLALWFELRLKEKRLDAWVLTSGGISARGDTPKPADLPEKAWKEDFAKYDVYVAHTSWRLHNL